MCCGGRIGSVHTPSDSNESDLRQSVVSQHLRKACSPDVHVAMYCHVVTLIKASQQYNACWRRRLHQLHRFLKRTSCFWGVALPLTLSRWRSLSSHLSVCVKVFQFLKRVHAYASWSVSSDIYGVAKSSRYTSKVDSVLSGWLHVQSISHPEDRSMGTKYFPAFFVNRPER